MRQGELLALRWADVDVGAGLVPTNRVRHTDIGTTLDLYSHVSPAVHEGAAFARGDLLS